MAIALPIAAGLTIGSGCSVVGNWRLAETKPTGSPFPVSGIAFNTEGRYSATGWYTTDGAYDGEEHTNYGDFTRQGNILGLEPDEGPELVYKTRRRWDGKLVMTVDIPGKKQKVSAVFARTKK